MEKATVVLNDTEPYAVVWYKNEVVKTCKSKYSAYSFQEGFNKALELKP